MLNKKNKGFTLAEIIVVVSIISVLGSVVIFSYSNFNDRLALSTSAQEMALAIREAQTYGINVKETSIGGGDFTRAFGIYFDQTNGSNTKYYVFADKDNNKRYGDALGSCSGSECVEMFTLRNGIYISAIGGSCPSSNSSTALHISFLRPNPDAMISFTNSIGLTCSDQSLGTVTLQSPKGRTVSVNVYKTGQIDVQ